MPHYKDGTEARVGDFVFGKPYNTDHVVAGTIISITPGVESCNCQVQFTEAQPAPDGPPSPRMAIRDPIAGEVYSRYVLSEQHGTSGAAFNLYTCVDYGAVADFTPVRA